MVARETSLAAGLTSLGLSELFEDLSGVVGVLARFAELLEVDAVKLGLIGPRESNRLIDRHILDSAALFFLLRQDGLLIDVGSGAGLPGLVLSILRQAGRSDDTRAALTNMPGPAEAAGEEGRGVERPPGLPEQDEWLSSVSQGDRSGLARAGHGDDAVQGASSLPDQESQSSPDVDESVIAAGLVHATTTLVEPKAKAAAFLRRAARVLGTDCAVVAVSAEAAARSSLRESGESVVIRAVAPPSVSVELTLPLTRVGGRALIPIGDTLDQASLDRVGWASEELGGSEPQLIPLEVPGAEAARWVMIIEKARSTPERYPRRPAVSRRRPLGGSGVT